MISSIFTIFLFIFSIVLVKAQNESRSTNLSLAFDIWFSDWESYADRGLTGKLVWLILYERK